MSEFIILGSLLGLIFYPLFLKIKFGYFNLTLFKNSFSNIGNYGIFPFAIFCLVVVAFLFSFFGINILDFFDLGIFDSSRQGPEVRYPGCLRC